eukprot:CAMPEP_0198147964 /NCGR_PEP_ID=MMETSP1443-20131203/38858_1 /TAXON_ID=186043 /ORGANISM="Entomoneis sp., Strain CCMP2396" /LENGTH=362 /DNA_ID=CAMNT_0043812505 /DNA_START=209 /DNA_END=1297 /DNA_ORIENTATION=-
MVRPLLLHQSRIEEDLKEIPDDRKIEIVTVRSPYEKLDQPNARCLAKFLLKTSTVTELQLSCPLVQPDGTAEEIIDFLDETNDLQRLYWHGGLSDDAEAWIMQAMCFGLASNISVTTLHLAKFNLSNIRCALHFREMLMEKTNLIWLSLVFCDLQSNIFCLVDGLKAQQELRYFDLACIVKDSPAALVIEALQKKPIVYLHLTSCILESESMEALESLLATTEELEELHLPAQFLSCEARKKRFMHTLEHSNTTLQRVYISRRRMDNDKMLEKCQQRNKLFTQVRDLLRSKTELPLSSLLPRLLEKTASANENGSYFTFFTLQKLSGELTSGQQLVNATGGGASKKRYRQYEDDPSEEDIDK